MVISGKNFFGGLRSILGSKWPIFDQNLTKNTLAYLDLPMFNNGYPKIYTTYITSNDFKNYLDTCKYDLTH